MSHSTPTRLLPATSKTALSENELKGLIELVNRTWERRADITPDTTTRQRPTPMSIFKLLPQTNCKQCGEPTCYTFALKLAASQKELYDCPLLAETKICAPTG